MRVKISLIRLSANKKLMLKVIIKSSIHFDTAQMLALKNYFFFDILLLAFYYFKKTS
jgi:hypothetical protein